MLFRRRSKPTSIARARAMLWPTRSFERSWRYGIKRVLRVNATPYAISMGVALGMCVSFTPLLGLHFALAFILVYLLRANYVAAALGTLIGNPLTFPFIWALTYRVGQAILGRSVGHGPGPELDAPTTYTLEGISGFVERTWPIIQPMLVGSVPIGLTAGVVGYALTYWSVVAYQRARAARAASMVRKRTAMRSTESVVKQAAE